MTRLRALGDETNVNKGSPSKYVCSRKLWPPFGDSSRVDLVVFGRVLDVFGGGPLCHGLVMCWIVTMQIMIGLSWPKCLQNVEVTGHVLSEIQTKTLFTHRRWRPSKLVLFYEMIA